MMKLKQMALDPSVTIDAIDSYLDGLSHGQRLEEMYTLSKDAQKALYDKAEAAAPLDATYYVPDSVGDMTEVIHWGFNSLPAFRRFQKRFARPEGGGELFGYNEGGTRPLIGPGYYVAQDTAGNPEWEKRGAYVVNYFRIPEGPVVSTWPAVKPNSSGLQMFVYNGTRDFMRRVSSHMSVGKAYKGEKPMPAYFMLCRED